MGVDGLVKQTEIHRDILSLQQACYANPSQFAKAEGNWAGCLFAQYGALVYRPYLMSCPSSALRTCLAETIPSNTSWKIAATVLCSTQMRVSEADASVWWSCQGGTRVICGGSGVWVFLSHYSQCPSLLHSWIPVSQVP